MRRPSQTHHIQKVRVYYKFPTTERQLLQLGLKHFDAKEHRLIANNVPKSKNTVITRFDTWYFLQK